MNSDSQIRSQAFTASVLRWSQQCPILAIVLVALLAVVVNCYPVIFCGKSMVSPMSTGTLVYNWWPPLPGMAQWPVRTPDVVNNMHGSDTYAMMWWGVPMGFVESRSLLEHGELPLWNRYSHAGETLIGQAISMLGDPLQWLVILGHGSACAWDLKFLAAKFLFCCGFGLLVLRLLDNHILSLIYSALAAYCGAFFFINNHPAFFVFSYAPWILLAAIEWFDLHSDRRATWGLIWLLANFACFNAGHVEVAVALIGGLNLTALIYALTGSRNFVSMIRVLGRVGLGTLLFLGLTAPVWLSFLVSLPGSFTAHEQINVTLLPTKILAGIFDDLFYLLLQPNVATAPGTSLLILVGCCLSLFRWRQLKGERFYWINSGAIAWWIGCIFGWVPSSLIAAVPLLNRVGHVETDFSYLLVMHLTIQSAYGFKTLTGKMKLGRLVVELMCIAGIFAGLVLLYLSGNAHEPEVPWNYFLCAAAGAMAAPLLFVFLQHRQQQMLLLGWAGILILGFIPNFRFGLYNFGNDYLLMLPGPRVRLNSPSEAVNQIKADTSGPFRMVNIPWGFMGNYSAVYELEDIRSCSPLSNGEFVDLIRQFPGMELSSVWELEVVNPVQAQPLLNFLNVKYLLAAPKTDLGEKLGFRLIARHDFAIVENLDVWPRAFFANHVTSIATIETFIQHLATNGKQPFVSLTPQDIHDHPGLLPLVSTNAATITPATNYRLSPNATEFDVHAASAGVVCLTEGQARDFTATANHQPKAVLTVNRAFKGIYLDQPGDYQVQFTYRPRHWRLACMLFWISAGGVVALLAMNARRTRHRQTQRTS
jgi:hypothetical protein